MTGGASCAGKCRPKNFVIWPSVSKLFLGQRVNDNADQLSGQMNDILLAQDYQDLTGQVIKKVTALVADVENNLLKLVLMASHVDRFAGIHHDREQLRSEQEQQKEPSGVKVRRSMPISVKTWCPVRTTSMICYPVWDSREHAE